MGLFRKQVLNQHSQEQFGEIVLAQPVAFSSLFILFVCLFITSIAFITNASYTQTQTVVGQLTTTEGDITFTAPQNMVVDTLFVKPGLVVEKGTPLVKLTSQATTVDGSDLIEFNISQLQTQIHQYHVQKQQLDKTLETQIEALKLDQTSLNQQQASLQSQLTFLSQRTAIAQQQFLKFTELAQQGLVSELQASQYRVSLLELKQQSDNFTQQIKTLTFELDKIRFKLETIKTQQQSEHAQFDQLISDKKIQIAQMRNATEKLFVAQKDGIVSTINIKQGQRVSSGQFMFTIAPLEPKLYAELLIPSRSIGFIQQGTPANLKLQAYPFEKFGALHATLSSIPTSIISSSEVNWQSQNQGPIYQVNAELSRQTIDAYGQERPLQNGMLLTAELQVESRSLAEWLFEPIIAALGE
ncbi:HlyD family secretion protein [Psychrosphaera sp. B3R10]|uniref:HlyD family efflux transporter periplasmic adaptor subunit n=1 Tax=Psychrosphaera algicola TaxID=3023714 RepID=A0ABT5FCB4_9GAMM|nr:MULTISPECIES: HlyD family efflux transporter periplasmic adaptor subunit [unclassified Psychrosphaera]MBU2880393.1 HlyD family secretion protein [Psychrosphaera sp. I2R16]MBU2987832.1 HlyD family secretion protein [Psychrosphaera sp. B3R10]MDC2889188.1 HlyD family efflux transporter periplasmic adaptor subunit [Psychrosphaera sp. G1-22]MDO6720659.1 HlyD family efflux transporter periplasmic adaptor subunit [Psychrosphaera sp. 1_MG-2023]